MPSRPRSPRWRWMGRGNRRAQTQSSRAPFAPAFVEDVGIGDSFGTLNTVERLCLKGIKHGDAQTTHVDARQRTSTNLHVHAHKLRSKRQLFGSRRQSQNSKHLVHAKGSSFGFTVDFQSTSIGLRWKSNWFRTTQSSTYRTMHRESASSRVFSDALSSGIVAIPCHEQFEGCEVVEGPAVAQRRVALLA